MGENWSTGTWGDHANSAQKGPWPKLRLKIQVSPPTAGSTEPHTFYGNECELKLKNMDSAISPASELCSCCCHRVKYWDRFIYQPAEKSLAGLLDLWSLKVIVIHCEGLFLLGHCASQSRGAGMVTVTYCKDFKRLIFREEAEVFLCACNI